MQRLKQFKKLRWLPQSVFEAWIAGETSEAALFERFVRGEVPLEPEGFRSEHTEHIFHPFWQAEQQDTRRTGGTGLGLSVTRHLARLLGGDVEVESVPGEGSRFTVTLPRETAENRGQG